MNKIIFPLKFQMRGAAVANLQDGLRLLLEKGVFQLSDADRQGVEDHLRVERAESLYSETTRKLAGMFQERRRLELSGEVYFDKLIIPDPVGAGRTAKWGSQVER